MFLELNFKSVVGKSSYLLACVFTAEGKTNTVVKVLRIWALHEQRLPCNG